MLDKNTTANMLLLMQLNTDGYSYNVNHLFPIMKYTPNIREMKEDKR